MRENGINKLKVKADKVTLRKDSLSKFTLLANKRDIRTSVVNKLLKVLESEEHFETPLVSNRVSGKDRLLDGNHRYLAMEKYFERHPQRKVEVWLFNYNNLTAEEEKKEYTKWNLGTKQSANDFIKQYWDDFEIVNSFKNFPIKVLPTWSAPGAIEFKMLMQGYMGNTSKGTMDFIESCKELGLSDAKVMKSFLMDYQAVFGVPDRRNMHYKKPVFTSLFNIWLNNHQTFNPSAIQKAFTKLRGHERVVYYSSMGATKEVCNLAKKDILHVLNSGRSKNLFMEVLPSSS